ncbi:MAG: decaprenylphospho-beta-D-erythro-pentofuranosid-2-ulose 2-reductase [Acidimicrobiia bacterium]|nr:decaprenylphospho-beta-D-erythro-pentofuranosid-2-ulose 2-reductase [Acidimicrobiia bacterium]
MNDALGSVQSALVIGGSSDIGVATARALAGRGCRRIVLAGRDPDAMRARLPSIHDAGAAETDVVPFDALDTDSHESFVEDVFGRHHDFDVVLVAFGVLGDQAKAESDGAAAVHVAMVNYVGAMSVMVAAAKALRRQGHGVLVVLSSVAGERARRSNFVYGSSKAGIDAFAQGLADSMVGTGARVMVVRPGFVKSKMTEGEEPAPMATTPEAVAEAIVGGLGSGATTVWVPSTMRWVMSALRHLPRPVFRRLPI